MFTIQDHAVGYRSCKVCGFINAIYDLVRCFSMESQCWTLICKFTFWSWPKFSKPDPIFDDESSASIGTRH